MIIRHRGLAATIPYHQNTIHAVKPVGSRAVFWKVNAPIVVHGTCLTLSEP